MFEIPSFLAIGYLTCVLIAPLVHMQALSSFVIYLIRLSGVGLHDDVA